MTRSMHKERRQHSGANAWSARHKAAYIHNLFCVGT